MVKQHEIHWAEDQELVIQEWNVLEEDYGLVKENHDVNVLGGNQVLGMGTQVSRLRRNCIRHRENELALENICKGTLALLWSLGACDQVLSFMIQAAFKC